MQNNILATLAQGLKDITFIAVEMENILYIKYIGCSVENTVSVVFLDLPRGSLSASALRTSNLGN